MELSSDITSEDLDVFLQEAEEQLQLLDEAIVQMEQAGNDSQLLQEIFRAAHTIKGSSAMIGYAQMTELAHVMESLLDKVSKGTLAVSTPIVDALLHSVDLLREMKDSLTMCGLAPGNER